MTPQDDARLAAIIGQQPHPLVFVTISGAHLYGFASADSDVDLRGAHVLPLREALGFETRGETIEVSRTTDNLEIDLVTHDVKKFMAMLLRKNGYVLEQLLSPLIVRTSPAHDELKSFAPGCITRHHVHHYLGFADTQWKLFTRDSPPRVKPLLYVYRVLLTGIHLMRTGQLEASLPRLNRTFGLPHVDELIAAKAAGREKETLADADVALHEREYRRLLCELEQAGRDSRLPEAPTARPALNDLLVRLRMGE